MTHEKTCFRRQAQNFSSGCIQGFCVAAWKVATSGAYIRHEHGVAQKNRVTKLVSHAGGRMAWHEHRVTSQAPHGDGFTVGKQVVKLRAILLEA